MQWDSARFKGNAARWHWAKAAFMIYGSMTLANMLMRSLMPYDDKDNNDGIWNKGMWSNDIGHRLGVYVGRNDKGQGIYLHPLKAFMEMPELLMDHYGTGVTGLRMQPDASITKLGGKASPVIGATIASFTGIEPSGFKNDIYGAKGMDHWMQIAIRLSKIWVPYSVGNLSSEGKAPQQKVIALASQSELGANKRELVDLYERAIGDRDDLLAKQTTYAALNNGMDARQAFVIAMNSWRSNQAKELNYGLETREQLEAKINDPKTTPTERKEYIKKMRSVMHMNSLGERREQQSTIVMNDFRRLVHLTSGQYEDILQDNEVAPSIDEFI